MSQESTNYKALLEQKRLAKEVKLEDLLPFGSRDSRRTSDYAPAVIQYKDFVVQLVKDVHNASEIDITGLYLPLTGGTMTGSIDLAAGEALQLLDNAWINLSTDGFAGIQYQGGGGNRIVMYNNKPGGGIILDGGTTGKIEFKIDSSSKLEFTQAVGVAILDTLSYRFGLAAATFTGDIKTETLTTNNKTWTLPNYTGIVAVSAVAGVTQSGLYSSFTIENGIITAAS